LTEKKHPNQTRRKTATTVSVNMVSITNVLFY
jgi:hypothetical protein